jgi:hypothetical protein
MKVSAPLYRTDGDMLFNPDVPVMHAPQIYTDIIRPIHKNMTPALCEFPTLNKVL